MAEELSSQTFLFDAASGGRTKTERMAGHEGFGQAGATAHCCVIATEACKPFWRQRSRTDDAQSVVGGGMITKLPDDVLSLVLQHMDFQEKCTMQLVCRKFSNLLSSPPPGLWGEMDLLTDIIHTKHKGNISGRVLRGPKLLRMPWSSESPVACPGIREALSKCRRFIRRLQGFDRIICNTDDDFEVDPSAFLVLMAKLSGAFSKGTELTINLTSGADHVCGMQRPPLLSCLCIAACMWAL